MRDLPKRVHKKGPSYYYVQNNKWTRLSSDRDEAIEMVESGILESTYPILRKKLSITEIQEKVEQEQLTAHIKSIYRSSRSNARARDIAFELTLDSIMKMAVDQDFRCAISGIRFSIDYKPVKRRPFAPSIDRIETTHPYTDDNVRLVCWAVNSGLQDWGLDVFCHVARQTISHQKRLKRENGRLDS